MPLIETATLTGDEAELPAGVPLFGWESIVTIANITSTAADPDFPVTNLANTATSLEWRAQDLDSPPIEIEITVTGVGLADYVGIARHNFADAGIGVEVGYYSDDSPPVWTSLSSSVADDDFTKLQVHFDGTDGSTSFVDSSTTTKTLTAAGGAVLDDAEQKFGTASLLCDGADSYAVVTDHADFSLGSGPFTIELFFNCNDDGSAFTRLAGQSVTATADTNSAWVFTRNATPTNVIQFTAVVGTTLFSVTGTTQFNNVTNTGWHHLAAIRTGDILRMFIDGVQEGGDVAITGAINNSTANLTLGTRLEATGNAWVGWIDEVRISVGVARYTANFTPPTEAFSEAESSAYYPETNEPLLFWFTAQELTSITIRLTAGTEVARAAVLYVGKLLLAERGLDVGGDFTIPHFARKTEVINGRSSRGDYLGSIVLSRYIASADIIFKHFTPTWYRENFDPFVLQAQSHRPFFYAWHPSLYDTEVAFCWLTDDPVPMVSPITDRVAVTLRVDGILT